MNQYPKSTLDCDTPKGKSFIKSQNMTMKIIERTYRGIKLKKTKDKAEKFDAYIHKDGGLYGVCEIKTRPYYSKKQEQPCTFDLLKQNDYLITAEKLKVLQNQSKKFKIKSYIFVNLPFENKVVQIKITDENGEFLVKYEIKKSTTYATCNEEKGEVERINAYIKYDENNWSCIKF